MKLTKAGNRMVFFVFMLNSFRLWSFLARFAKMDIHPEGGLSNPLG